MSGKLWERRARLLADQYHVRVYAPDLPNHGQSALVRRFDYDLSAKAVAAAVRPLCPSPMLIVGASSGGIVAMKLAARTRAKVAVIGVGWSFTKANLRSLQEQSRPSDGQDKYLRTYSEQGDRQVAALYNSFQDLAAIGSRPLLNSAERRALAGRLLIINGADDKFFLPGSAERLHRGIRGSELHLIPRADHLGPLGPQFATQSWAFVDEFLKPVRR